MQTSTATMENSVDIFNKINYSNPWIEYILEQNTFICIDFIFFFSWLSYSEMFLLKLFGLVFFFLFLEVGVYHYELPS